MDSNRSSCVFIGGHFLWLVINPTGLYKHLNNATDAIASKIAHLPLNVSTLGLWGCESFSANFYLGKSKHKPLSNLIILWSVNKLEHTNKVYALLTHTKYNQYNRCLRFLWGPSSTLSRNHMVHISKTAHHQIWNFVFLNSSIGQVSPQV